MASTIGALEVALTANTAAFSAGTQRARRDLQSFAATANSMAAAADRSFTSLTARFLRWTAIIGISTRALQNVAKENNEFGRNAAAAITNVEKAWANLERASSPYIAWMANRLAEIVNLASQLPAALNAAAESIRRPMTGEEFQRRDTARPLGLKPYNDQFVRAYGFPDSVAVTPSRINGPALFNDLLAGDAMVNQSLADFTASGFQSAAAGIGAQNQSFMRYQHEQRENAKYLKELASSGIREALEQTQQEALATKAALLDMSSALVFGMMRGGNAIGFVIDQLAMTIIQAKILKPLIDSLDIAGSGGGGSGVGAFLATAASWLFGSGSGGGSYTHEGVHRAAGGPVSAGRGYIVGENGPEFFVPGSSGSIIPNGAGGMTINVDARGSDISPADLRAAVAFAIAEAHGQSVNTVAKRMRGTGRRV